MVLAVVVVAVVAAAVAAVAVVAVVAFVVSIRFHDFCARFCWVLISLRKQTPNSNDGINQETEPRPHKYPRMNPASPLGPRDSFLATFKVSLAILKVSSVVSSQSSRRSSISAQ